MRNWDRMGWIPKRVMKKKVLGRRSGQIDDARPACVEFVVFPSLLPSGESEKWERRG